MSGSGMTQDGKVTMTIMIMISERRDGRDGMMEVYVRVRNHAYLGLWRRLPCWVREQAREQAQAAAHVWLSAWQR